jgi:hypothetical protein
MIAPALLVLADGGERYVGLTRPLAGALQVEFCGRMFQRTAETTRGGWPVYREPN